MGKKRMMQTVGFLFVLAFFVLIPLEANSAWLDPAWTGRRTVSIDKPGGTILNNFQVRVALDSSFDFATAKSDGSDVRFTSDDGVTLIPFWIGSWNPGTSTASLWVRVPTIPAGGTTLFLYYGNPTPPPGTLGEVPPTGPFLRAAGNPIVPTGDPGSGSNLLAENIVYDNATGHYWMVFANYRNPGVGLIYSDNPSDAGSWQWFGNVYNNPGGAGGSFAPDLLKYNGTWYLFFSDWSGLPSDRHNIVVSTATSITGPYSTPLVILSPDPGTWENWRVDEPYVFQRNDGKWMMMYMGDATVNIGAPTERIGYAYADNILGPYTKFSGNPVLDYGPPGSYDAGTVADPLVFEFHGTYYIGYTVSSTQYSPWQTAYATTTDWQTFTKHGILFLWHLPVGIRTTVSGVP